MTTKGIVIALILAQATFAQRFGDWPIYTCHSYSRTFTEACWERV